MSTALTAYTPATLTEARGLAETFARSGMFSGSIQNPDQALVIMMSGAELGLPPMASLRGIIMVKGKVTLNAELMLFLIIKAGIKFEWLEDTNSVASIKLFREGWTPYTSTFTQEDAHRAGLSGGRGDMYSKYPRNMLRARAVSNAATAFCPDVMVGVYHHGELDDVPRDTGPMQDVTPPAGFEAAGPHKWAPEEKNRFFGWLGALNKANATAGHGQVAYEDLKGWLDSTGRPKPSAMPSDEMREKMLDYLNTDAGRAKYWAWSDDRAEAEQAAAEVPDADFEEVALDNEPEAPTSLVELWVSIEALVESGGQAAIDVVGTFEVDLSVEGVRSIRDENKLAHIKAELDKLAVTDPNESPC